MLRPLGPGDVHPAGPDGGHTRSPSHRDRPLGHEPLELRAHPWFDVPVEVGTDVRHRHVRARPHEVQRRLDGRIPTAHDEGIALECLVPLAEMVGDVRQRLTRHPQPPRVREVAGRDHHGTRRRHVRIRARARMHGEAARGALDALHLLVRAHRESFLRHHAAVVGHRIAARRLLRRHGERDAGDRDLLGRGEERDVRRVSGDRAHDAPLLEHDGGQPVPLGRDRRGEPAGSRADDREVQDRAHTPAGCAASPMIWSRRVPTLTNRIGASTSASIRSR